MSAFKSIKQGLTEAAAHAKGKPAGVKEYQPYAVDVADLRRRLGLTQKQFAARFGFSVPTLRHWERGDRTPHGPALVLLNLIDREPKVVRGFWLREGVAGGCVSARPHIPLPTLKALGVNFPR